jgi:hypothetical protein
VLGEGNVDGFARQAKPGRQTTVNVTPAAKVIKAKGTWRRTPFHPTSSKMFNLGENDNFLV